MCWPPQVKIHECCTKKDGDIFDNGAKERERERARGKHEIFAYQNKQHV